MNGNVSIKRDRSPARARITHLPIKKFRASHFKVPIPKNEPQRLMELQSYQVLDTPPEDQFDHLTRLAAEICGTPIALLSLVDSDRQWFKSRVGLSLRQTPREYAFCAHAIMSEDLFLVRDATQDAKFAANPLVVKGPRIRFYAGMPLVSPERHALGTLCVLDHVPRDLTLRQRRMLELLSHQVMVQLLIRRRMMTLRQGLEERKRMEKRFKKDWQAAEARCHARTRWVQALDREIQAMVQMTRLVASQMRSGPMTSRQLRQLEQLKNQAGLLQGRSSEILRFFHKESTSRT